MRISVDTSQDSHDDIRKVIRMLQHFVGDQDIPTNAPEDGSEMESQVPTEPTAAFTSMFGAMGESASQAESAEEDASSGSQPEGGEAVNADDLFSDLFDEEDAQQREQSDSDTQEQSSTGGDDDYTADNNADDDDSDDGTGKIQIY